MVVGGTESTPVALESTGGDTRTPMKFEEASGTKDWLSIPSPLYRLEALAKTQQWDGALSPWLANHREDLLATIGDRRAFASAAIGAGDLALAQKSGLPDTEIKWLTMHALRNAGDNRRAFFAALNLDPARYPDHALVLIEAIGQDGDLLEHPQLSKHVSELDPGIPGRTTLAAALEGVSLDEVDAVAVDSERLGDPRTATALRRVVTRNGQVDRNAWSRAATGASLTHGDLEKIYVEYPAIADDLITANRVETGDVSDIESPYLRARMCIDDVDELELRSLGATDELLRRAYALADSAALKTLLDELPDQRGYFEALDMLRRGEIPDDLPDNDTLKAVAASIRSGKAHPNALADASTWPVLAALITDEDAEGYPEQAAVWQLERAHDDLANWRFESALDRARSALKWSHEEAIRDEALNVIGFVLYQQESDEAAITALDKALEGEYSANLQANIGIIAKDLHPDTAALHLGRLAEEAPTLDLKLAAVRHAFEVWTTSSDAWDEDGLVMPGNLLSTFRAVVVADIPYDDYVSLMQLLARADDEWIAKQANTQQGPHVDSAARRVYRAKASHDPSDYVDALTAVSKQGNKEEWFIEEKDGFVGSLRSLIFSEEGSIGPASYAFAAIDAGLELDDFDYVTLACGASMSILGAISEDDGLPSEKVTAMVVEAHRRVGSLDQEQRELVKPLVRIVGNRHGAVVADFHAAVHDQILEGIQTVATQLYGIPRHRIRWGVVSDAVRPMVRQARESAGEVTRALKYVTNEELREYMTGLAASLKKMASRLDNPQRAF